jgi:hypothetical protein
LVEYYYFIRFDGLAVWTVATELVCWVVDVYGHVPSNNNCWEIIRRCVSEHRTR